MTVPTGKALFDQAFDEELLSMAESGVPASEWNVAGRGKKKSQPDGEDVNWWRAEGPKMVERWMLWRRKTRWTTWVTPDGQPGIELEIQVPIPKTDEVLKAYVDRVFVMETRAPCIVDLKSGARSPDGDLQLAIYRYGIHAQYGVDVEHGAYWDARSGDLSSVFELDRYKPGLIELWYQRFIQAKTLNLFIPHPTFRCRACSLRDYCVAYGGSKSHLDPDYQEITNE